MGAEGASGTVDAPRTPMTDEQEDHHSEAVKRRSPAVSVPLEDGPEACPTEAPSGVEADTAAIRVDEESPQVLDGGPTSDGPDTSVEVGALAGATRAKSKAKAARKKTRAQVVEGSLPRAGTKNAAPNTAAAKKAAPTKPGPKKDDGKSADVQEGIQGRMTRAGRAARRDDAEGNPAPTDETQDATVGGASQATIAAGLAPVIAHPGLELLDARDVVDPVGEGAQRSSRGRVKRASRRALDQDP